MIQESIRRCLSALASSARSQFSLVEGHEVSLLLRRLVFRGLQHILGVLYPLVKPAAGPGTRFRLPAVAPGGAIDVLQREDMYTGLLHVALTVYGCTQRLEAEKAVGSNTASLEALGRIIVSSACVSL
jgi:hypothetical protein